jgi:hypothetical protein
MDLMITVLSTKALAIFKQNPMYAVVFVTVHVSTKAPLCYVTINLVAT